MKNTLILALALPRDFEMLGKLRTILVFTVSREKDTMLPCSPDEMIAINALKSKQTCNLVLVS